MISYREANIIKTSSLESALSQASSMSPEQLKEFVNGKIDKLGVDGVLNIVKQNLLNLTRPAKTAAGDIGWAENKAMNTPEDNARPSQLKQKIQSGDWLFVLAFLLLIGTAGASDFGASWSDLFKGFSAAAGSGFLGWAFKWISSRRKNT